jgi:hypothetical protein
LIRAVAGCILRQHFAHQKNLIAPPGNCFRDQFLGGAVAIHLGGIDQRHAEIEPGAQRLELVGPPRTLLAELPGPLTKNRDGVAFRQRNRGHFRYHCRCVPRRNPERRSRRISSAGYSPP